MPAVQNDGTEIGEIVQSLALEDPFGNDDTSKAVVPVNAENSLERSNVVFAPRSDRLNKTVTGGNAQGLFPPSAALFVAKYVPSPFLVLSTKFRSLFNQRSDDQLDVSVHGAFDTFGKCHVRIRRDKHKQPYAFVQFEVCYRQVTLL